MLPLIPAESAPPLPLPPQLEAPDTDERWAAWQAKGKAGELKVRRTLAFVASIALIVASVVYSLF